MYEIDLKIKKSIFFKVILLCYIFAELFIETSFEGCLLAEIIPLLPDLVNANVGTKDATLLRCFIIIIYTIL